MGWGGALLFSWWGKKRRKRRHRTNAVASGAAEESQSLSGRTRFQRESRRYKVCACGGLHVVDYALYLAVAQELLAVTAAFVSVWRQGWCWESAVTTSAALAVLVCVNVFLLGVRLASLRLLWPHYACLVLSVTGAGYFCYERAERLWRGGLEMRESLVELAIASLYASFILVSYLGIHAACRVRRFLVDWAHFDESFLREEEAKPLQEPPDAHRHKPCDHAHPPASESQPSLIVLHF